VRKDWQLLLLGPVGLFAALTAIISSVPDDWFAKVGLKCDIPPRWNGLQRSLYLTMLITFLAAMTLQTGHPWPLYYFILWLVPLGTSFSMYMILREDIQHSNTGSGRLAHSRDFRGNALVRWSVFPMGQAYHLAHHLYPMVPHYNLPKVDALLRETEEYRREAVVVDSLLWPKGKSTSKRPLTEPSTAV
jgi:fatty acid desaturase